MIFAWVDVVVNQSCLGCRYFERRVPVFATLRPTAVQLLAANTSIRDVPVGSPICLQDGMAESLLVVLSGSAHVYRTKKTATHQATQFIQATRHSIESAAGDECATSSTESCREYTVPCKRPQWLSFRSGKELASPAKLLGFAPSLPQRTVATHNACDSLKRCTHQVFLA